MKIISNILISIGVLIIIYVRFSNIELTESQLFINFLHFWILAIGLIIGGYAIKYNCEENGNLRG